MKTGFFEEQPDVKSSMRLNSFVALCAAIALAGFSISTKQVDANTIALISVFVVGAFAPKAVQKFAEQKNGGKQNEGNN